MASKILSRIIRGGTIVRRGLPLAPPSQPWRLHQQHFHRLSDGLRLSSLWSTSMSSEWIPCSVTLQETLFGNSKRRKLRYSTSSSPETAEEQNQSSNDEKIENQASEKVDDEEAELSIDDLVKLVDEKEELLKSKHKQIEKMQDKVLRSYAEMENVLDRTKREAENAKKFAIQNFAKSLLDVADNLGRASSVVKESFAKLEVSQESSGATSLLKTLLEGVDMTEKQLAEVFKKFGIEKYDPTNEHFDPHRHHAVFQVPDASKPHGTVAAVLKTGYTLHDRIIRPAEVGVIENPAGDAEQQSSES